MSVSVFGGKKEEIPYMENEIKKKQYNQAHIEEIKENNKKYYQEYQEDRKEKNRKYYIKNVKKILKQKKEYNSRKKANQ